MDVWYAASAMSASTSPATSPCRTASRESLSYSYCTHSTSGNPRRRMMFWLASSSMPSRDVSATRSLAPPATFERSASSEVMPLVTR